MSEDAKQVVGCALLFTMLAIGLLGTGLAWVVVVAGRLFRRKAGA